MRAVDGDEFSLECEVSAVPAATWTWKRNDKEVLEDCLNSQSRKLCIYSFLLNNVRSKQPALRVGAPTKRCLMTVIHLYLLQIEADGTRIIIASEDSSSTLSIKDAVKEDFGSIECVASNDVGEPATAIMTAVRVGECGSP